MNQWLCKVLGLALLVIGLGPVWAQKSTQLHWYGQAAFKIETPSGGVLLIDPWLNVPTNPDKQSIDKLGRVDYILVTHGHRDHIGEARSEEHTSELQSH